MPPPVAPLAIALAVLSACDVDAAPESPPPEAIAGVPPPARSISPAEPINTPKPPPRAVGEPPPPRPSLRVATYNILAAKRGMDGIIDTVRAMNADLIALQEVDRNTRRFGRIDQPRVLADALGLEVAFVPHHRYDGGEIGVALLSRFPLQDVTKIRTPGSRLSALSALVDAPTGPLHVTVVHLTPTDPRDPPARRAPLDARRLAEARRAFEVGTAAPGPAIILGDFNSQPDSPEHGIFAAALNDACRSAGATWPTPIPVVRIDYIWTSDALEVASCSGPLGTASDHRPIVAELLLDAPSRDEPLRHAPAPTP